MEEVNPGIQGLGEQKNLAGLFNHLTFRGEIKKKAAGGRGVFISCMRNIFQRLFFF